jgi:hypothetical protein
MEAKSMGETELEKRIDEQFQEWFQLLNKSSITIGFLSAIAALSVESVPLLILSFVAWMSFILYNKNEAFPNILRILRKIDNGQNSVVTNIRTKYEKKLTLHASYFHNWLYWGMVLVYVLGIIVLLSCPSVLVWH